VLTGDVTDSDAGVGDLLAALADDAGEEDAEEAVEAVEVVDLGELGSFEEEESEEAAAAAVTVAAAVEDLREDVELVFDLETDAVLECLRGDVEGSGLVRLEGVTEVPIFFYGYDEREGSRASQQDVPLSHTD